MVRNQWCKIVQGATVLRPKCYRLKFHRSFAQFRLSRNLEESVLNHLKQAALLFGGWPLMQPTPPPKKKKKMFFFSFSWKHVAPRSTVKRAQNWRPNFLLKGRKYHCTPEFFQKCDRFSCEPKEVVWMQLKWTHRDVQQDNKRPPKRKLSTGPDKETKVESGWEFYVWVLKLAPQHDWNCYTKSHKVLSTPEPIVASKFLQELWWCLLTEHSEVASVSFLSEFPSQKSNWCSFLGDSLAKFVLVWTGYACVWQQGQLVKQHK